MCLYGFLREFWERSVDLPSRNQWQKYIHSHGLEPLGMSPGAPKPTVTKRDEDAHSYHARIPRLFLLAGHIDESTQPSMCALVDEVYEILADSMQSRGEGLVLDSSVKLDTVDGLLPNNRVAGFDIKVDEKKSGDGGQVWEGGHGGRGRDGELGGVAARGGHCENYPDGGIV